MPFYRALRASVAVVENWVELPDELAQQMRYTHIFSAVHGFLGVRKLCKVSFSDARKCLAVHVWAVVNRVKKFVSSLAWFCKAGRDCGYFQPAYADWASSIKIVYFPFHCCSLGFSLVKLSKICLIWLALRQIPKNDQVVAKIERLQQKANKEFFYTVIKTLEISSYVLERLVPGALVLLTVHSVAIASIRIVSLVKAG